MDDRSLLENDFPAVAAPVDDPRAWDSIIPRQIVATKVLDLAVEQRRLGIDLPLPMQCCVGPATRLAAWASILTWAGFLTVPWPVLLTSGCHPPGQQGGAASVSAYYNAKVVWACVAPFILTLLTLEWNCLKFYILPVIQVHGDLKTFGVNVNFYLWLLVKFAVSLASHMDLVTNGIFLATTLRTMSVCSAKQELACIWLSTMQDGMFGYIPHYEKIHPLFQNLVWFLWMSMFIQALFGWLGSCPLSKMRSILNKCRLSCLYTRLENWKGWARPTETRFDPENKGYGRFTYREMVRNCRAMKMEDGKAMYNEDEIQEYWETCQVHVQVQVTPVYEVSSWEETDKFLAGGSNGKTMYQTYFDDGPVSQSGHGAALWTLADSCRMVTITATRVDYAKKKVKVYLSNPNPKHRDSGPAFGLMKQVAQACGHKLVLAGIMQTGLQMNLQVTLLGMTTLMTRINHGEDLATPIGFKAIFTGSSSAVDQQMAFSIAIGLINVIKNAVETGMSISWISKSISISPEEPGGLVGDEFRKQITSKLKLLSVAMFCYVVVISYTISKLFAVFMCNLSMFNITGCAKSPGSCLNNHLMHLSVSNATVPSWW